ncbi:MAG: site-2 protease family protein [Defluviitaleaceae bacterium]|nr:site-2 protease family protein [Defluviitaleaceae bacterium]
MNFFLLLPGAFFAPIIHEFVKARVSAALGDTTPKHNGFITWNPFKYFEPIGFFMMLYFRVGWGQPVTTSPFYYKNKRMGIALTYATPIVANLFIGMLAVFLMGAFSARLSEWAWAVYSSGDNPWVIGFTRNFSYVVNGFGMLNIRLAVFNLIPVFPMAMNKLLHLFVSPETSMRLNHYEKPLQILLFLMLVFGVVEMVVGPISQVFIRAASF